jgi:hypothetical protein
MLGTELACAAINDRGIHADDYTYSAERLNTVISTAQTIISTVLGDFSYSIFERGRFSAGASTSRSRRFGDPYFKYKRNRNNPLDVTPRAYPYAKACMDNTPLWHQQGYKLRLVPGNRVTTVPKNSTIDRTIAKEPDMNMYLQLAIGSYIRDRLKLFKINLDSQEHNQDLALQGSIFDDLSTIDLSSASDSISYCLVRDLFPVKWYAILDDLRSPIGQMPDGSVISWEKFSSMGNGFTFELESLLFYAITKAVILVDCRASGTKDIRKYVSHHQLTVYGDDIICHRMFAPSVVAVLDWFGFKTNLEKTFISGPFRESCGKHWYRGVDVTPFYVRRPINSITRVMWLANSIRAWSYDARLGICDPTLYELWRGLVKKYIPKRLRGGKDVHDITCLCSPGKPRDKLQERVDYRMINDVPALLRYFQFNNIASDYVEWDTLDVNECVQLDRIVKAGPVVYGVIPNMTPLHDIPLFPKEIG